jgi:hypothetical protein
MNFGWLELRDGLQLTYSDFLDVISQLSPDDYEKIGVCGNWSAKDVISHLIGWDTEAIRGFMMFAHGEGEAFDYSHLVDVDQFNARSVIDRKDLTWDAIIQEQASIQHTLQAVIKELHTNQLDPDSGFGQWLRRRIEEYQVHTEQIRRWIANN